MQLSAPQTSFGQSSRPNRLHIIYALFAQSQMNPRCPQTEADLHYYALEDAVFLKMMSLRLSWSPLEDLKCRVTEDSAAIVATPVYREWGPRVLV